MTWRVVHVSQSEKMRLKLDNLLVQKMGQEFTVPLSDISIIVAEGGYSCYPSSIKCLK